MPDITNEDGSDELCDPKSDFYRFDCTNSWSLIYERLKNISSLLHKESSTDVSRQVENRWKNRYRDIIPYDNTRVVLHTDYSSSVIGDYINANFVQLSAVPNRKYILTQGPLKPTTSHFWLMVWENHSPLIVMLNRLIEKGSLRCHPYFPSTGGQTLAASESKSWLVLDDVDLQVCLEEEHDLQDNGYIKRVFSLVHLKTDERRVVVHMNYVLWPDFGVPSTPSGMLNFLWSVRNTGFLSNSMDEPAIIHCSAGVGRSGAFVLIDFALCLIEQHRTMKDLDLCQLFLELRSCRMGIIQTAEQFRFCYTAVIRGAEAILSCPAEDVPFIKFEAHSDEQESANNGLDSSSDEEDEVIDEDEDEEEEDWDGVSVEDVKAEELDLCGGESLGVMLNACATTANVTNRLTHLSMRNRPALSSSDHPTRAPNSWLATSFNDDDAAVGGFGVGQTDRRLHPRTANLNRSNNALLVNMSDPSEMELRNRSSQNAEPSSITLTSESVSDSISTSILLTQPHGDGLSASSSLNPTGTHTLLDSEDISNDGEMESFAAEYMAATYDLQRRREVRQQRQARLRERIEEIRNRMHEADLQRRRWIPQRMLYYLRRLYSESGWISTSTQAILTTALILCVTLGFTACTYNYFLR